MTPVLVPGMSYLRTQETCKCNIAFTFNVLRASLWTEHLVADSGTTDGVESVVCVLQQLKTLVNAARPLTYVTVTLLSKCQCTVTAVSSTGSAKSTKSTHKSSAKWVSSYTAQYPVLRTFHSTLHLISLAELFNQTPSTSLGSIQPYATINAQRLLVHISTNVYSQALIYTAEWAGVM